MASPDSSQKVNKTKAKIRNKMTGRIAPSELERLFDDMSPRYKLNVPPENIIRHIHMVRAIENELKKRNINSKIVRLKKFNGGSDLEGTRKIISKIISAYEFHKSMERIEKNEEDRHS